MNHATIQCIREMADTLVDPAARYAVVTLGLGRWTIHEFGVMRARAEQDARWWPGSTVVSMDDLYAHQAKGGER